ncbi:hypothetical protein CR513_36978, partial [Mucuna pruriens]
MPMSSLARPCMNTKDTQNSRAHVGMPMYNQERQPTRSCSILHINIPFAEAIATMPKYDKFLKEVISNKRILGEFELLPSKLKELGGFTIPYTITNSHFERGLCDLGPSINLIWGHKTIAHPRGVIKNVLVKVDKFIFLANFIILDMEDDKDVLIVLGQSFLNIIGTLIDYAFLKLLAFILVIISTVLIGPIEDRLLRVLRDNKEAFAGINPIVYTYRIYMEDKYEPQALPSHHLNPKMKEVVKGEVLKLLDARIIYPIFDSK